MGLPIGNRGCYSGRGGDKKGGDERGGGSFYSGKGGGGSGRCGKVIVEGGSERKELKILNQVETYLDKSDREEVN